MSKELSEAAVSLVLCLRSHPRDWSADHRDAWLYGIIVGWGAALPKVADKHNWPAAEVKLLGELHAAFDAARNPG